MKKLNLPSYFYREIPLSEAHYLERPPGDFDPLYSVRKGRAYWKAINESQKQSQKIIIVNDPHIFGDYADPMERLFKRSLLHQLIDAGFTLYAPIEYETFIKLSHHNMTSISDYKKFRCGENELLSVQSMQILKKSHDELLVLNMIDMD